MAFKKKSVINGKNQVQQVLKVVQPAISSVHEKQVPQTQRTS